MCQTAYSAPRPPTAGFGCPFRGRERKVMRAEKKRRKRRGGREENEGLKG